MLKLKNVLVVCRPSFELLKNGYGRLDMCSGARTRYCAKFFTSLQVVVHKAAGARSADTTTPSSKILLSETSKLIAGTRRCSRINY